MPAMQAQLLGRDEQDTQMRRCVATGSLRPKAELLRLVVDPDGDLVVDAAGKLPGRGLWVTPERALIDKACRKGLFSRAAKTRLHASTTLSAQAEVLLRKRCLELLGLARRGGQAVAGFEKVKAWIESGKAAVLVQARDASADGRGKLAFLAQTRRHGLTQVSYFCAEELSRALGREHCVHVALASGGMADRFLAEARRLVSLTERPSETGHINDTPA